MLNHGVDATIKSYGLNSDDIINISSQGTLAIRKWTKELNYYVY